ncbi:hypothetical protein HTZ84_11190 [Haloterrigena sp. SYSU A558-1]|uniref:DUF7344 domain-containing protein n=1 Tax=Haloterrigena gelatinilytica TaxID=2741724 RepID=A0A8J8KHP8_9EURY|nr:hypothetical protein [Haloterrigena gelatinilytica]NUB91394.1 hypothetical protein [Haloterrigena gelatinilytica]NUC72868.1 hypothetical protein [Haloterrigena gelatinilytica]
MNAAHISSEGDTEEETADADERSADERPADEEELSKDEIFHLLQNERRRLVLRYLRDTTEPVRMRDIAEQVAAWEHDTTVEELTSKQRQRVYIPLYQSHLSKLDEAGLIDYQKNRGIVERQPRADMVDQYLQDAPETDSNDGDESNAGLDDYYVGSTVLGFALLLGAVLELPFTTFLSGIALSACILLLFTVSTIKRLLE